MKTISIYESNPRLFSVLRFTLPTVIMMVFASMYGIIDGIFLSNFIGSKALSANNIVYPLITVVMAVNLMFATGSNAIIAKKMGEGKQQDYGMIKFLGQPFDIFECYMRLMLDN